MLFPDVLTKTSDTGSNRLKRSLRLSQHARLGCFSVLIVGLCPGEAHRLNGNVATVLGCPPCPSPCQMSRLHRELERLTEERDRARDEVKRSEQHRQQLEAELKVCMPCNMQSDATGAA